MWSLLDLDCFCLNEVSLKSFFDTAFTFLTLLRRRRFFSFKGIWAHSTLIQATIAIKIIVSEVAIR